MLLPLSFCLLHSGAFELDVEMLAGVINLIKTDVSLSIEDVLGKKRVLILGCRSGYVVVTGSSENNFDAVSGLCASGFWLHIQTIFLGCNKMGIVALSYNLRP